MLNFCYTFWYQRGYYLTSKEKRNYIATFLRAGAGLNLEPISIIYNYIQYPQGGLK